MDADHARSDRCAPGHLGLRLAGLALAILVGLFGAFALIHGLFSVLLAVGERRQSRRWWLLLVQGLVGIAVGIITFV